MGVKDTVTKDYMNDPRIFADAFNFLLYNGRQVILPEKLHSIDTTMIGIPYGADGAGMPVQKFRDNMKCLCEFFVCFALKQKRSRKNLPNSLILCAFCLIFSWKCVTVLV